MPRAMVLVGEDWYHFLRYHLKQRIERHHVLALARLSLARHGLLEVDFITSVHMM
jgi:hypothetical protein